MMKHRSAYWVKDGDDAILHVGRTRRAEADTLFNGSIIYTPRGFFRKPEETVLVVPVERVILAEVESKLGYGPLPIFDPKGNVLNEARREMEDRARSFRDRNNRPSDDPIGEAIKRMNSAHQALNRAASQGGLDGSGADARKLCAKASILLAKQGCFSRDSFDAIRSACNSLSAAIGPRPLLKSACLTEAALHCQRADALAQMYGGSSERNHQVHSAGNSRGINRPNSSARIVPEKITITKGEPETDLWLQGHLTKRPDYTFTAKVFDVGSVHGIDEGRISKLEVRHKGEIVANYERGWDIKPRSWREKAILKDLLAGFPDDNNLSAKARAGFRRGRNF